MVSRREFLQSGLALSSLPLAGAAGFLPSFAAWAGQAPVALYKAIFDTRFDASRDFAAAVAASGTPTYGIAGDITSVWYRDLHHRWQSSPAAIGGLTGYGAMFCLEHLAWDHRMRVIYRAEHRSIAGGSVEHVVTASEPLMRQIHRVLRRTDPWAANVAALVTAIPEARGSAVTATVRSSGGLGRGASDSLYSWVIAPISQA